ncbi:MAG: hypothetical protein ACLFTQ_03910 [Candidatus Aenigmatarchaeota archaeon]
MFSRREKVGKALFVVTGILIFVLSIQLLKSSAGQIAPDLESYLLFVKSPRSSLGFGWLMSYLFMSGYPVTVLSTTLLEAGVFSELFTFLAINGSRLGAALIVILIGVVGALKKEGASVVDGSSIGFLTLIVTYTIQIPAIFLGLLLLRWEVISFMPDLGFLVVLNRAYEPLVEPFLQYLGPAISLLLALAILYFSLSIFERAFKDIKVESFKSSWVNFLMEKPHYSFLLGAVLTFFSQTVALSIGIVVPLYIRGFIQRKNLIPYIMGACITTFGGTLAAAFLLESQVGINISLTVIAATAAVSLLFLSVYDKYSKAIIATTNFFLGNRKRLTFLLVSIFVIPFLLVLF